MGEGGGGGQRGAHVTVTDPSALDTTRGLVAADGQYTLEFGSGLRGFGV